jgi:hypothetical protein
MSKKKNLEISSIENEYKSLIPVADRFCKEVKNQLDIILSDLEIQLGFPVHYRIKTWDSLLQKSAFSKNPSVNGGISES